MKANATLMLTTWALHTQHKRPISDIEHNDTHHNDTQHNDTLPLCWMSLCWMSRFTYWYADVIMLSVVMLSVAYLNVVMLTVIAPTTWPCMKMLFQPEKFLRVQKARLLVPSISKEEKSFYNINTWCLCLSFWLSQVRCRCYKPFYTCKKSFCAIGFFRE